MKKYKKYAAVIETTGKNCFVIEQGAYCNSKIEAINSLRLIDDSAAMRLSRIDKIAQSCEHFIQLANENKIIISSIQN